MCDVWCQDDECKDKQKGHWSEEICILVLYSDRHKTSREIGNNIFAKRITWGLQLYDINCTLDLIKPEDSPTWVIGIGESTSTTDVQYIIILIIGQLNHGGDGHWIPYVCTECSFFHSLKTQRLWLLCTQNSNRQNQILLTREMEKKTVFQGRHASSFQKKGVVCVIPLAMMVCSLLVLWTCLSVLWICHLCPSMSPCYYLLLPIPVKLAGCMVAGLK